MKDYEVPTTARGRVEILESIATTLATSLKRHGDEVDFMAADVIRMGLRVLLDTDLKEA